MEARAKFEARARKPLGEAFRIQKWIVVGIYPSSMCVCIYIYRALIMG
jgi:hypothetical protein